MNRRRHDRRNGAWLPAGLAALGLLLLAGNAAAAPASDAAPATPRDDATPTDAASAPPRDDTTPTSGRRVLRVDFDGVVIPAMSDYVRDAVRAAEEGGYQALLVVISTPGGRLDSTREIAQTFLSAQVPVVTYVAPAGAQAASAGTFITMAGHVAAMAPATNIGAAHPVMGGGEDPEEAGGKHMGEKVENDTAAFARAVAAQRGRNAEWAEKAVRESVSITADEAVEENVVDLVAVSERELLAKIDGRTLTIGDEERVLRTEGAKIEAHPMTISQRTLMVLGDPNIAYILGMIGLLGLMMELYNPGMIFPGAIGAFFLLLAGIGLNVLPVNAAGVVLLVLAVALFVAEMYTTTFGLLTLGGVTCLLLGSALLMDTADPDFYVDPSFDVGLGIVIPTVLLMSLIGGGLAFFLYRAHRRKATTGQEGLVGELGRVRAEVGPEGGRVHVHGELWNAVAGETLPVGARVRVVAVRGLELTVERADAPAPSPADAPVS